MTIFISATNKLLFLILTILLVMVAAYSILSFGRLENEFEHHKGDTLKYAELQLDQQVGQLNTQLTAWLESFTGITELQYQNDFHDFAISLKKQHERLQLYFNVIDIWLIDEKEVLLNTSLLNEVVLNSSNDVLNNQLPLERISCEEICSHLISLPILNFNGDVAVVTFTVSMVDMLYELNSEATRDLAVIRSPKRNAYDDKVHILSSSNINLSPVLKEQKEFDYTGQNINTFTLNNIDYSIVFLYLDENEHYRYSLALIEDITGALENSRHHRMEFVMIVVIVFVGVAVLIYFVFKPFTRKLLLLSNALPMLSNKEFTKFRQTNLRTNSFFNDEFDVLAASTKDLSIQLEKLNDEVEQKTNDLEKMAMFDSLTGLPNRYLLNHQLNEMRNHDGQYIAILFLDLDDFKKVNDSHGHSQGDQLLIEAAKRLQMSVRATDTVYRFGGDEFVIILQEITNIEDVKKIADKVIDKFSEPILLSQSLFYVSTSIGIVMSEDKVEDADALISYADIAMYEAKASGGSKYHIYHDDMFQRISNHVYLENEVRQALLKQQFSLSLQPQVITKTNKLHGFEALLRWNHPEKGFISPNDFIPILQNSAQIIDVGYWVIRRCFELTKRFIRIGHNDIRIAINLSAEQFADPNLQLYLESLLIEFDISSRYFELELTEQTLVKDMSYTISVMNNLKALGFSFAIDDFGTGYSSLSYLRKMPVDVIKIDKSFVDGMMSNKADHQITLSTIAMVKSLELTIVAEGVETVEQLNILKENHCDIIQGYYFSKPIPESQLFDELKIKVNNGIWQLT